MSEVSSSTPESIEPRLLRARPRTVFVEMTSNCNVRCIYCPVSLPGYHGQDLQLDVGLNFGLTSASPDVQAYVGIAKRF